MEMNSFLCNILKFQEINYEHTKTHTLPGHCLDDSCQRCCQPVLGIRRVGVVCIPFTILPAILGVVELIYAAKLFSDPPQIFKPSTNIAVFEIASVLTGNVFSMAVGILALVFYNDQVVKDYFARLNGTLASEPDSQPVPASLPEPESFDSAQEKPAPASEEPVPPESAPAEQPGEEKPAKPKRGPRKVAKE